MSTSVFSYRTTFFLIVYLAVFFATCNNALFWDTIQFASLHPDWYHTTNFNELWLPKRIDSGHPMTFGLYIAVCWEVFGRSIIVTHLAMLPLVVLLVIQASKLGRLLFPNDNSWSFVATALLLTEAVLLSQSTLASPDVALMAFFLLGINAIIENRKWLIVLAVLGLAAISTRGAITAFCLYFFSISYHWSGAVSWKKSSRYLLGKILPFIPGGLLTITYLLAHRYIGGWKGFQGTEWEHGFDMVSVSTIFKNFVILIWRLCDFGKVIGNIGLVLIIIYFIRRKAVCFSASQKGFISFGIAFFLIGVLPLCFFQGLLGARYLLPFTTVLALLLCTMLEKSEIRHKKVFVGIVILAQLSGSFMYYPKGLSTAWDSTLAHLPYFRLRNEFKNFMVEEGIDYSEVGSQFPITGSGYEIDLNEDKTEIMDALDKRYKYVLYSNVCNRLHDSLDVFYQDMQVVKYEKRGAVEMILFKEK